ncbi:hypothetical protein SAMN04487907_101268 [Zunongwangia mangrovi]|uniref:Uncharacterized protein n=1 Tax=Zunongwangia mangrovi TaxID=1334022 RepID=A0A1I1DCE7_9FLAO|nr:hypothetical protein [Zunongwangia mangrovi]SFB72474.1 hypothetical protein SAMN04487907_101268 [Zunongwangia mangrovi]
MKTIFNYLEKRDWYLQLLIGAVLAILALALCAVFNGHDIQAIIVVTLLAVFKEHYLEHRTEEAFHWRNFLLLILPVVIGFIILHY